MERIEDWNSISKDVVKKFGLSSTMSELTATVLKTTASRSANSPYSRNILKSSPRYYKIGRILPTKIGGIFPANFLIKEEFYQFIMENAEYKTNVNIQLLCKTFPETFELIQGLFDENLKKLEELD